MSHQWRFDTKNAYDQQQRIRLINGALIIEVAKTINITKKIYHKNSENFVWEKLLRESLHDGKKHFVLNIE